MYKRQAIYLLRGVSLIYFLFLPPSIFNSVVFGVTFGLLWLSTVPPTNGLVGHIFGTKHLGLLYGIVFVSHQIGSFLGAYLGDFFMRCMEILIMHGTHLSHYQFLQA